MWPSSVGWSDLRNLLRAGKHSRKDRRRLCKCSGRPQGFTLTSFPPRIRCAVCFRFRYPWRPAVPSQQDPRNCQQSSASAFGPKTQRRTSESHSFVPADFNLLVRVAASKPAARPSQWTNGRGHRRMTRIIPPLPPTWFSPIVFSRSRPLPRFRALLHHRSGGVSTTSARPADFLLATAFRIIRIRASFGLNVIPQLVELLGIDRRMTAIRHEVPTAAGGFGRRRN